MTRRPALLVTAGVLLAIPWLSWSEPNEVPALRDPFPFNHDSHAVVFADVGVSCVDCHPVGLTVRTEKGWESPSFVFTPPMSACHTCHRAMVRKGPSGAPPTCTTCHEATEHLKPPSHDMGWIGLHGDAARAPASLCKDCHTKDTCVECHDRRGAVTDKPHPPGFRSFHGVDARFDPKSCSTCHTGTSCLQCHTEGARPW